MPRFSEVGDTVAIANSYADKVIVYVEGDDDVTIFYGLTGQDIRERLEFRTPAIVGAPGNGARQVCDQVAEERVANRRIFGLLDGEAAAWLGAVDQLVECGAPLFKLDQAEFDGLIFLGHHEVENLLLMHGRLSELISKDVLLRHYQNETIEEIEASIAAEVRHFFFPALIKYASLTLHDSAKRRGDPVGCKVIDSKRFRATGSRSGALAAIKQSIAAEGLITWDDLWAEVRRTYKLLLAFLKAAGADEGERWGARTRLTDGKSVLSRLKQARSPGARWETHLLTAASASSFSGQFRERLVALTGA